MGEHETFRGHTGAVMDPLYTGPEHEGLRAWSREWHDAWGAVEYDLHEFIDAGDDVIAVVTVRGRARTSGADAEFARYAGLWTIRDGKVVRVVWFPSRREAIEARRAVAVARREILPGAMSEENVKRFVAVAEAFNQIAQAPDALAAHLQGLLGGLDSKVQFHPQQAALEGGYAGHEGVMQGSPTSRSTTRAVTFSLPRFGISETR